MSAMQEESDVDTEEDGIVGPDSDGASLSVTEGQHEERPEGTSLNDGHILRGEDEPGGLEPASESNGTVFGGYRRINKDDGPLVDEGSELGFRQGTGRPSSADGSLPTSDDIPDDTPSLKV